MSLIMESISNSSSQTEKKAPLQCDKHTDIGVLPGDWEVGKIGNYCTIKTGCRNTQDRKYDGEYPFFVRSQTVERIDSYSYDGEAVLTAGDGVGTGKVFHYVKGRFDVHQRVYRMSNFNSQLDGRYFFYQFSTRFYDRIMSMTAKSSVDSVRMDMIAGMQVPIPSIQEQKAIVSALSDMDELIETLENLISKKQAIKLATMQQLLTGKTRLPGFSGEWEMKLLGDHVRFLSNGVNSRAELTSEGTVKYLHYGEIHACPDSRLTPVSLPSLPVGKAKTLDRLKDGDLVFADASEDREGVSKSVEIERASKTELVSGLHTIAARFDKSVLADGFKGYLQNCPDFSGQLRRLAAGTKVYATQRKHIASVEMRLPGVEEQKAIATVLSDMDAEISALEKRRDKTKAIKQGMMQSLLTGRVRLVKPKEET